MRKFEPKVYAALKRAGYSNREIAQQLGVDESSVRRGLSVAPIPKRKVTFIVIEE